jgi:hypothetical protein
MKRVAPLLFALLLCRPSHADNCGPVELRFKPGAANLQIVAWIEDPQGNVVDTPYITRVTGQFGLANRPGAALLKTDFRWPYSRREMVFPIWAHRRNHHYPKIVMGGSCGNSPQTACPGGSPLCGSDCEDSTIAYHSLVSSHEPFYCSPSGPGKVDATSCASAFTGSKGAYADAPAFSLYPPRADLTSYNQSVDSPEVLDFAKQNDLVAVSAATPPPGNLVDPPVYWYPNNVPAGDYVAFLELSQEEDWSPGHSRSSPDHPNQADSVSAWDFEGHNFLGQPSVVYQVPFHCNGNDVSSSIGSQFVGYSTWDGSDGTLHAPDSNIVTNMPGSGAGRLLDVDDGTDVYRVKVITGGGGDGGIPPQCLTPLAVTDLKLEPGQNSVTLTFKAPADGPMANRFAVRYREGTTLITDDVFDQQVAAPSVAAGAPGDTITTTVDGLLGQTKYAVAVRGVAPCGKAGPASSQLFQTLVPKFTVLHGCFIATAAYGSPMERHVARLREFRDSRLLTNPAGQLVTAIYYAFSPPLANAIATDSNLRALARAALRPIVALVTR